MEEITKEKLNNILLQVQNNVNHIESLKRGYGNIDDDKISYLFMTYGNSYNHHFTLDSLYDPTTYHEECTSDGDVCWINGGKIYRPLEYLKQQRALLDDCIENYDKYLYQEFISDLKLTESIIQSFKQISNKEYIKDVKIEESKDSCPSNGYVYIIRIHNYYKIGQTLKPSNRLGEYTKLMEKPETIICERCCGYLQVEADLHSMFDYCRTNGEWFQLSDEDLKKAIDYIKSKTSIN